jgi:rhodanese-related sulfurtransferase
MTKRVLKKWGAGIMLILVLSIMVACSSTSEDSDSGASYHKITAEEAMTKMAEEDDVIILDVRTLEEYETGHITEAISLPLDEIEAGSLDLVPDKEAVILVYCRSGSRSKQASKALVDEGYTNVYDFGGIIDWPYDIVN